MAEKTFIQEFTTPKAFDSLLYPSNTYPSVIKKGANVYVAYVDNNRVKAGVWNGSTFISYYIDSNSDWTVVADGHYRVSMGIDRDGYFHLSAHMHNYPNATNDSTLPTRYQSKHCMYFRSDSPYDLSAFTFLGDDDTYAPAGKSFNNLRYQTDNNGVLYATYRMEIHDSYRQGIRGLAIAVYDEVSGTWTSLGVIPPQYTNSYGTFTPTRKCVFWENGGSAGNHAYQGFYSGLYFDSDNTMHLATEIILGQLTTTDDISTHVVYAKSYDGGVTWKKADDTILSLPIGVDVGSRQGDVIVSGETDVKNNTAKVVFGDHNRPIVAYSIGSVSYFRGWNGFSWDAQTTLVVDSIPTAELYTYRGTKVLVRSYSGGTQVTVSDDLENSDDSFTLAERMASVDKAYLRLNNTQFYGANILATSNVEYGYFYIDISWTPVGQHAKGIKSMLLDY